MFSHTVREVILDIETFFLDTKDNLQLLTYPLLPPAYHVA